MIALSYTVAREGGHMMYMVPAELAKLKADATKFYSDTLQAAGVK